MKGLIKKDLLMIKSNFKLLVILFFAYGFMAFQGEIDLSYILPFMSVMIMISTFSYDSYNKWDAYAIALPDGRKNSVKAKYLATLLLILVTSLVIAIVSSIISYVNTKTINVENVLSTLLGGVFATTLVQSIMYPSIYKFGVERARIGIFSLVFGVAIIVGIISQFIDFENENVFQSLEFLNNYFIIILLVAILGMLYLSYKISEEIYKKKEY